MGCFISVCLGVGVSGVFFLFGFMFVLFFMLFCLLFLFVFFFVFCFSVEEYNGLICEQNPAWLLLI